MQIFSNLHQPYLMMLSYRCKLSVALARPTPGIMFATLPILLACRRVLAYSSIAGVQIISGNQAAPDADVVP